MSTQTMTADNVSAVTGAIPVYTILLLFPSAALFILLVNMEISWGITLMAASNVLWLVMLTSLRDFRFQQRLNTASTLLEAVQIKDFSIRSRKKSDRFGLPSSKEFDQLEKQIDQLMLDAKSNRFADIGATDLLSLVIESATVAIIATDATGKIRIINKLASKLTGGTTGMNLADINLPPLPQEPSAAVDHKFGGASGRWQVLVNEYRHEGKIGNVISISSVEHVLLTEESAVWQRLIRVISHEINNSLTPVTSFCQSLEKIVENSNNENQADLKHGLTVIRERAGALKSFVAEYAQIARLPDAVRKPVMAHELINGVAILFPDITVTTETHEVFVDSTLTQQLLINFVHNALEASDSSANIVLGCQRNEERFEFFVKDHGCGVKQSANLFVPFYSTKTAGRGIGLALCRQIAVKQGGFVSLTNNENEPGATAVFSLPL